MSRRRRKRKKKTRGQIALDKVNALRLIGDDKVSSTEMMAFLSNAQKIFTDDMLEDERARNKKDWRKMTDAERARMAVSMRELVDRKNDFVIELDPAKLPSGEEGHRSFEERLAKDPEIHDFEQHPNVRTGKDAACFWWWPRESVISMTPVQRRVMYDKTQYNTFLSVISRIWEEGNITNRWKGRTWKDVVDYIETNYGPGEECHRVRSDGMRYTCFQVDTGGRFHVCIRIPLLEGKGEEEEEDDEEIELPPHAKVFPIICSCKNPVSL